jgi:ribosomal protein S18 acetylase RimI-like enzyme
MPELHVREMTKLEFEWWRDQIVREYADEQVAAGSWSADEALELSRRANRALLEDGYASPGMLFLRGALPDGTPVGVLWISLRHPRGTPDCAFIFDIAIEEEHRGAGYGRALLAAAEDVVRSHGVGALELNVFGGNDRAIGLYASSGYHVVTQQMRKTLG